MIKLEGRVLLFDVINQLSNKISKDCKLTMPEKVPLTWNFEHDKPIGFATPIRDDKAFMPQQKHFPMNILASKISGIFLQMERSVLVDTIV